MALDQKRLRKILDDHVVSGITAPGILRYPKVNTPDTKFKKEGEWVTDIVHTPEHAGPLQQKIEELRDTVGEAILELVQEDKPKTKKLKIADPSFKPEEDDEGEETGNTIFKFKRKASHYSERKKKKYTFKVTLRDAKNQKFPIEVDIWGGTEAKIAYRLVPFYNASLGLGIKLELRGIQILNLVTAGGDEDIEFEEEEGLDASTLDVPESTGVGGDDEDEEHDDSDEETEGGEDTDEEEDDL